jgi:hypothetical protein
MHLIQAEFQILQGSTHIKDKVEQVCSGGDANSGLQGRTGRSREWGADWRGTTEGRSLLEQMEEAQSGGSSGV